MRTVHVLSVSVVLLALMVRGADDLPQRRADERGEREPKLFLDDLGEALPFTGQSAALGRAPVDVERAKAELDRAQRKQVRWQKLAKAGVLAQIEAESAVLQCAYARKRYEHARAAQQQHELEALKARLNSGGPQNGTLAAAEAALQTAQAIAAEADAALQRTQLLLAESNADRQRRLFAAGVGSKKQVQRAEAALQQFRADAK